MNTNNQLVFVCGTLQTGYENHHLLYNAVSLGKGKTVSDEFVMRALRTPYVSDMGGNIHESTHIHGELYAMTVYELYQIDAYKGYPRDCDRRLVEIQLIGSGSEMAWMYINNNLTDGYVIQSGNYRDYRRPGEI